MDNDTEMNEAFTVVDLFAGAGGLSEGFRQAGFEVLAANDFDDVALATFRQNHPETEFMNDPIQNVSTNDILAIGGMQQGDLDVLVGGPPCQAFSVYNHQRGMHDERSGLFREYLRIVAGLMPRIVVMENVTGITSVGDGQAVAELYRALESLGYYVEHRTLRSEEYGVPQERRRIFFVALRESRDVLWPQATHAGMAETNLFNLTRRPYVTVWDAISDLPPLTIDDGEDVSQYTCPPQSEYQALLRADARELYNHVSPNLQAINIERLRHIPQGGSWRDIPFELLPAGMQKARRRSHKEIWPAQARRFVLYGSH